MVINQHGSRLPAIGELKWVGVKSKPAITALLNTATLVTAVLRWPMCTDSTAHWPQGPQSCARKLFVCMDYKPFQRVSKEHLNTIRDTFALRHDHVALSAGMRPLSTCMGCQFVCLSVPSASNHLALSQHSQKGTPHCPQTLVLDTPLKLIVNGHLQSPKDNLQSVLT